MKTYEYIIRIVGREPAPTGRLNRFLGNPGARVLIQDMGSFTPRPGYTIMDGVVAVYLRLCEKHNILKGDPTIEFLWVAEQVRPNGEEKAASFEDRLAAAADMRDRPGSAASRLFLHEDTAFAEEVAARAGTPGFPEDALAEAVADAGGSLRGQLPAEEDPA